MSAVAAGADSVTAVIFVGQRPNDKATARLSDGTVRQPKAKKPIGKPKTVVGMGGVKKTWMMHLQHDSRPGVWSYLSPLGGDFLLHTAWCSVIFVQLLAGWWTTFPAAAMVRQGIGHDQEKNFESQPD